MRLALALAALLALWLGSTLDSAGDSRGEAMSSAGTDAAAVGTTAEAEGWAPLTRPSATPRAARSRATLTPRVGLPQILLRIRWCESRDNYRAQNPRSSASGAWQILDGTWNGFRGYTRAVHAPRWVQDAKALALFADRGTQPWNASRRCWGR